jgi:hypothetical protein
MENVHCLQLRSVAAHAGIALGVLMFGGCVASGITIVVTLLLLAIGLVTSPATANAVLLWAFVGLFAPPLPLWGLFWLCERELDNQRMRRQRQVAASLSVTLEMAPLLLARESA